MPHPALVERHVQAIFDDPNIAFDSIDVFDTGPYSVVDQRFLRGPERPAVFYEETSYVPAFDDLAILFDSFTIPFDDNIRLFQNFSSRDSRDSKRRRPAVVVLA